MFGQVDLAKIDKPAFFQISLIALFCAFGGYLIVKYTLEQKPDAFDDDINSIGVDDLRPPVK